MSRRSIAVPLVAGALFLCLVSSGSANLITYTKEEGRADRVMVMDDTGAGVTELYALPKATPVRPFSSISPPEHPGGGTWIAFLDGDGDLHKIREDGTQLTRLLCDPLTDGDGNLYGLVGPPQWSPDGSEILVLVSDADGFNYPAVLDANPLAPADCSSVKPIYHELPPGVSPEFWELYRYATWNDDGSKIAFFETEWDLFDNIIGVQLVVLTKNGTSWETVRKGLNVNELPLRNPPMALDWQRGGDLLAFSLREGPRSAPAWLYWVDETGSSAGPMTIDGVPAEGEGPTWSPDGSQLMYFTGWQRKIAVRDHLGHGELGEVATILGPGIWPDWQRDPITACGDGQCEGIESNCSCPTDCGFEPTTEALCSDSIDNDCDGDTDCDDSDCGSEPACMSPFCGDGYCDATEDPCSCASDCGSPPTSESVCNDGLDNDCDMTIDCSDEDCYSDDLCASVDCASTYFDKKPCNAEHLCRWDNRKRLCVDN